MDSVESMEISSRDNAGLDRVFRWRLRQSSPNENKPRGGHEVNNEEGECVAELFKMCTQLQVPS
jgi:hypothetical protein